MATGYVYQPYPKLLTAPDGARVRVETEQDHDALLAQWEAQAPKREELLAQAADLGIRVDGRWSVRRIIEAIEAR